MKTLDVKVCPAVICLEGMVNDWVVIDHPIPYLARSLQWAIPHGTIIWLISTVCLIMQTYRWSMIEAHPSAYVHNGMWSNKVTQSTGMEWCGWGQQLSKPSATGRLLHQIITDHRQANYLNVLFYQRVSFSRRTQPRSSCGVNQRSKTLAWT